MMSWRISLSIITSLVFVILASALFAEPALIELDLAPSGWKEQSIKGKTHYILSETEGEQSLDATCNKTASSLYQEVDIDINDRPALSWQWRIKNIYDNQKEKEKSGADYPARIFVVIRTGSFGLTKRVINYVWASHEPVDSQWPHPFYTASSVMVTVASGMPASPLEWHSVERDICQDVKQYLDLDFGHIRAIGLMTDCDNSEVTGSASYRRIKVSNK